MEGFDRTQAVTALTLVAVVLAVGLWASSPAGPLAGLFSPLEYDTETVTLTDSDGQQLATVDVRIADTERERYVGLSKTATLDSGEGMLFVHEASADHVYVMRNMSFALDIIFVDPNGTVTTIHHAPVPERTPESSLVRYRGTGKYVLEVPRGFANETDISVGNRMSIPSNEGA